MCALVLELEQLKASLGLVCSLANPELYVSFHVEQKIQSYPGDNVPPMHRISQDRCLSVCMTALMSKDCSDLKGNESGVFDSDKQALSLWYSCAVNRENISAKLWLVVML